MKMLEKNLPSDVKVKVMYQHTDSGKLDTTVAVLYDTTSGRTLGVGRSMVNHRKEKNPSRKMGRTIAVGRAMAAWKRQKHAHYIEYGSLNGLI